MNMILIIHINDEYINDEYIIYIYSNSQAPKHQHQIPRSALTLIFLPGNASLELQRDPIGQKWKANDDHYGSFIYINIKLIIYDPYNP